MTAFTIDSEAMKTVVAKAIIDELPEAQKQSVLEQAVGSLIAAPRDTYGRAGTSPLQQAFNNAVNGVATKVVAELIDTPELRERIEQTIHAKFAEILQGEYIYDAIGYAVGQKIQELMSKSSY